MPSDGQDKTVWNLSGRYTTESGWYARGQVGTSFRLPDAYELYVVDPCCEQGNPNLVAEDSFNTEFGVGLERGMLSGEVLGFYRETDNLIDITYDLPAYPDGFVINTDQSVTAWGLEAVLTAQVTDWAGLTLDYTHSEVEAEGTNEQIQDIPRDLAKAVLTLQAPSGRYGGTAAMNWVGDRVRFGRRRDRPGRARQLRGVRPFRLAVHRQGSAPPPRRTPRKRVRRRLRDAHHPACGATATARRTRREPWYAADRHVTYKLSL
jgi:outer membrane cobalamin receptor